jgi:rubrerythrin
MEEHRSRREILVASAALAGGAAAALVASCGGDDGDPAETETVSTVQMEDDAAVLGYLLDLEYATVAAYERLAPRLRGEARDFAAQFRDHARAHAEALRSAIADLGGTPGPPGEGRSDLPSVGGRRAALELALDVEQTAIAAYAEALTKLFTDPLRGTLATIMAAESEHAAVWLGELGRAQVPQAFVTGPPPPVEDE